MSRPLSILIISLSFVIIATTLFVNAADADQNKEDDQPQLSPDQFKDILIQREKAENQIVSRAKSKLGKFMKPAALINYCLNPAKNIERFDLNDHMKAEDNEIGLFVIDKGGAHIGIMSAGKTVIHASPQKKYIVTEDTIEEAKKSFPNGWRKIGPDGILKEKYAFQEQLDNIMKEVNKPTPPPSDDGCPDCAKNQQQQKKQNGDL